VIELNLNEQQQELAEKNHNLIYWYARNNRLDLEEYYGELAIVLCKAAYHFDESLGYSFASYAAKCMDNRIRQLLKSKKQTLESNEEILSLDYLYYANDSDPFTLEDCIVDNTEDIEMKTANKIDVEEFADTLSNRDKYILKSLLVGKTQYEIADELGVSHQRVHQIIKRIRKKYQKAISTN
jgi:RNA polymerase sigma factor (sigma-70 family)